MRKRVRKFVFKFKVTTEFVAQHENSSQHKCTLTFIRLLT